MYNNKHSDPKNNAIWNVRGYNVSIKNDLLPSREKETWSSQVGGFSSAGLCPSSQSRSMTDKSESEKKEKSIGERKKFGGCRIGW